MSLKVINFDLNFIPTGVPPIVHIHQYDLGEIVTLRPTLYYRDELYNGMNLEECDFIVAYQRPDGSQQSYTIENHVFLDEYVFEFPLDANMTAMHGPNVMSLGFVDGTTNNILWTQNFILFIERHPIQSEDYMGSSVYDGMIRMLQRYIDEAYAATPPGYEEHVAKIREVENTIDDLREEIQENLEEANNYTDQQMGGLDSIYATLQDVTNAQNEGRAYAGQLVGDTETRILNDMSLSYQLKSDAETDKTDLQIYAEQVSTASATEIKDYLGLDYTSSEPGLTETGLLNTVITQTAESIVQEATAEFMTESEADGIITTKVNSKVEQKATEITTTISQTYEKKEDAEAKALAAQSYTDSKISQTSSSIRTEVNAYTDDKIKNLKIGAQNLLRGTNEYTLATTDQYNAGSYNSGTWGLKSGGNGTVATFTMDDPPGGGFTVGFSILNNESGNRDLDQGMSPGSVVFTKDKSYTLSGYARVNPNSTENDVDYFVRIWGYKTSSATSATACKSWRKTISKSDGWVYFEETFTVDWDVDRATNVKFGITGAGSIDWCGCKLEEGNKATAWQPNEFDIKKYTNTQIQQTNDRIDLIATAQETTDGDLSTLRSEFDIEVGKIAAMVAAGYIEPDGNQGWTSSYSIQLSNSILNTVSSTYATKGRVNEVESKIVTTDTYTQIVSRAVSGIKIGGENLIRSTELVSETVPSANATWALADAENGWYKQGNSNITLERINVNNAPSNGIRKGWRFTHSGNITSANHATVAQYSIPVTYQQEYTISFYTRLVSGAARAFCQTYVSASGTHTHTQSFDELTSDWKRCVFTFTHDFENSRNQTGIYFGIEWDASVAGVIEICGLKLELGNVATDWCPSVYDMEAYTQASLTVGLEGIHGRVEGLETWKNNIKIGSQNLLKGTNEFTFVNSLVGNDTYDASDGKWTGNARLTENLREIIDITNPPAAGFTKSIKITGANTTQTTLFGQYVNPASKIYSEGMTYSLSGWFRVHPDSTEDTVAVYIQNVGIPVGETSVDNIATYSDPNLKKSDGWKYIRLTYCPTDADTTTAKKAFDLTKRTIFWFGVYASTGTVEFAGLKLEEGVTPTSYSLNPYDTEYKVDKITVAYTDFMQTDEYIKLVAGDYDNGDKVIMAINGATGTATIDGNKVNINGNTTFTNMQSAVQNAVSGSVKRIYYRTTTNSQPSAPSSGVTTGVTSTATTAGGWRTVIPDFSPGDTFYWTCEEYKKNDGKFYYTNVSPFHATIVDGANIYAGSITLTKFDSNTQNTISTASSDASTAKSDAATAKTTAENAVTRYGKCTTDAATAAKTVTLTTGKLGTLATGAVVAVYFTKANSAATPTLNVNNTGAKQIRMVHGTAWTSGSNWKAGAVLTFTYDGTYWIVTNGSQTKDAYDKANTAATNASNALTAANNAVIESVTVYYCYDRTAPTQPTDTEITSTSSAVDQWTLRMPDPVYNGYYYECTQQKLNDGTITFTEMRRMSFTEGIAKWISSSDATKIDGGHIYAKSIDTGALNLYGELEILQSATGNVGGYIGYETGNNGVDDTNGMLIRAGDDDDTTFDSYAWKNTYKSYLHLSDSGAIIRSPYIQLRQSGTQAVKIINDNGLNLKEYGGGYSTTSEVNRSGVLGKMAITAQSYADDSVRANLHINAATLTLNFSDGCWFEPLTTGNDFFLQPGNTKGQIGSYTENSSGSYTKDRWWSIIWCKSTRFSSIYSEDTTVHALSDRRQKHDIVYEVPDDVIDKLKPAHFILNNDEEQKVQYGFIAQDVQEVFPGAVGELEMGNNKWLTLSYTYFIPLLVDKCQKLQKQIDELKGEQEA